MPPPAFLCRQQQKQLTHHPVVRAYIRLYRAGARRWSREAQDWNRQIAKEGSLVAGKIVEERKKALRESVMSSAGRPGRADEVSDRQYRGKECGNGLGICLGVAAAGEALGPEGARLAAAERTEAAIDLRESRDPATSLTSLHP